MRENKWDEVIRNHSGFSFAQFKRMAGTTASVSVRVTGFFKLIHSSNDLIVLETFQRLLGDRYVMVFPRYRVVHQEEDSILLELEYLGEHTLEDVLLHQELSEKALEKYLKLVCDSLVTLSSVLSPQSPSSYFVDEVFESIVHNALLAGFLVQAGVAYEKLRQLPIVHHLCHRDLSVVNILCENDGAIRFIDPRMLLPGALNQNKDAPFGSIVCDCAAILVSLQRKSLERQQLGRSSLQAMIDGFNHFVASLIRDGLFTEELFLFCKVQTLMMYAACRCDYCLAPQRCFLYEFVLECMKEILHVLEQKKFIIVTRVS